MDEVATAIRRWTDPAARQGVSVAELAPAGRVPPLLFFVRRNASWLALAAALGVIGVVGMLARDRFGDHISTEARAKREIERPALRATVEIPGPAEESPTLLVPFDAPVLTTAPATEDPHAADEADPGGSGARAMRARRPVTPGGASSQMYSHDPVRRAAPRPASAPPRTPVIADPFE